MPTEDKNGHIHTYHVSKTVYVASSTLPPFCPIPHLRKFHFTTSIMAFEINSLFAHNTQLLLLLLMHSQ